MKTSKKDLVEIASKLGHLEGLSATKIKRLSIAALVSMIMVRGAGDLVRAERFEVAVGEEPEAGEEVELFSGDLAPSDVFSAEAAVCVDAVVGDEPEEGIELDVEEVFDGFCSPQFFELDVLFAADVWVSLSWHEVLTSKEEGVDFWRDADFIEAFEITHADSRPADVLVVKTFDVVNEAEERAARAAMPLASTRPPAKTVRVWLPGAEASTKPAPAVDTGVVMKDFADAVRSHANRKMGTSLGWTAIAAMSDLEIAQELGSRAISQLGAIRVMSSYAKRIDAASARRAVV